ncbi:TIGR00269 family protein [Candidatus Micrarchaeota archaeon]|nr:TIGR00269 family protein [Candidatus Micrarchaeota archaeon]
MVTVSCGHCQGEAVLRLDYANLDLCGRCFSRLFERRVARANREFKMVRPGDVVAVGVSGGKDSAALLYVLHKMSKKGRFTVKPVLVDEGIAGYRDVATKKAEELCQRLGLELAIVSYQELAGRPLDDIMKLRDERQLGFTSCGVCGVLRKDCLNQAARKVGASKLAVGHNADDVAQTFLMNALRADVKGFERFGVVSGLGGQEKFVQRVKPLVYNLEKECALYCVVNDLPFHLGECPYSVEAFRGQVKDFLNAVEQRHPGSKFNVLQSFLALKSKLPAVVETQKKAGTCTVCGEHSSSAVCRKCVLLESLA